MRVVIVGSMILAACSGNVVSEKHDGGVDARGSVDGASAVDAAVDVRTTVDAGAPGALLGTFKLTYYYDTREADYTGADDTGIYDSACTLLAMVPSAFASSLAIEGTGVLTDGRIVNYDGSCGCPTTPCYTVLPPGVWATGAAGPLTPFRSIAVDRSLIPIGTHLYVKELDGVTMPGSPPTGGFVHDGCVSADDTGGAITGQHIDFFSLYRAYYLDLDGRLGLSNVTVYQGGNRCP